VCKPAGLPSRVSFCPVGLGLFVKADDKTSRSGGPCSELTQPVGTAGIRRPLRGSRTLREPGWVCSVLRKSLLAWAVGCRSRQTPPVKFWCSAAFPRSRLNSRLRFAIRISQTVGKKLLSAPGLLGLLPLLVQEPQRPREAWRWQGGVLGVLRRGLLVRCGSACCGGVHRPCRASG